MKLFEDAASPANPLRDQRLTAVNFVADAVNRTLDLKEVADNAVHAILAVMNLDAGVVHIWQEKENALRLFAYRGISEAFARQVAKVRRGDDVTLDTVLRGATKVIVDFAVTPHVFRVNVARAGFRSAVLAPIRAQGMVVGILALGSYKVRRFDGADIELIEVIANQLGHALVHAQLQADLRASEEQYRGLVENSDDAIYIADSDGRPRFGNPAFQRTFGFDPEELAALDPFSRIHTEDVATVRLALADLAQGAPVRNLEYRFCRKDGQWIDLQCNVTVFSRIQNRVNELQFVVREVTQARRRQQQLLQRNQQLTALAMLAEVANSSLHIEEIARDTLRVAMESTGMDGGAIHLVPAATSELQLYVHMGLSKSLVEHLRCHGWGTVTTGAVIVSGQSLDNSPGLPIQQELRSFVVVPVRAKNELLGTLGLISQRDIQFAPEVIEMVTAMGHQLGIAVANARLYEAQLHENEKLNALVEVSSVATQRLELETCLQQILHKSAQLLKADAACLLRYEAQSDQAEVVAATAGFAGWVGRRFPAAEGLFGQTRSLRRGRIFGREEADRLGGGSILGAASARSVLVAPLISRNEWIGALGLTRRAEAESDFTTADLELMEAFAGRAAVAIDNAQLLKDLQHKNELLELLIEEAHHRIKNNLQMISGLLQLEAESGQDKASAGYLQNAITRIQAIAQVHNLLSREMAEKVDTRALISAIVQTVIGSAPAADGLPEVSLKLENLWLEADQAVALALIVNELVANSVLHGRPAKGEPLRVRILWQRERDEVRLVVDDNGGGFPPGTDWQQIKGQGMNIVAQLARVNLRGRLGMATRDGGVCAELCFVAKT